MRRKAQTGRFVISRIFLVEDHESVLDFVIESTLIFPKARITTRNVFYLEHLKKIFYFVNISNISTYTDIKHFSSKKKYIYFSKILTFPRSNLLFKVLQKKLAQDFCGIGTVIKEYKAIFGIDRAVAKYCGNVPFVNK